MRKVYAHMLTVLTAALLFMPITLKAQEQMVIVTSQGDLQIFPASVAESFQYDIEQDIYTLESDGQTLTFGGRDIKQVYFADRSETAQDPLITPKATDKYNPNFERLDAGTYDILMMDTALCHTKILFKGDVPQLYVGKILSLENETAVFNCYVLTYKVTEKTADIRFRFSSVEELIYNSEFVLAANPDDTYFETKSNDGAPLPIYRAQRTPGLEAVPKIEIEKGPMKLFGEMGMTLTSADKSSLGIDAKFKLSEPRRNEKCARSFLAKIEYMGLVARGTYEKTTTLDLTPRVGINFEKDKYLEKPLFKASGKFMVPAGPVVIPLWLDLSGTLGYNIQAAIEAEMKLRQVTKTGFSLTAGMEYTREAGSLKPILDIKPTFDPQKPEILSKEGTIMARFSPYLRIDLLIDVVFGMHLDLMPYLKATYKGVERKGVNDFGSFDLEAGANLRGGLYFNAPFVDSNDYLSHTTGDFLVTKLYHSPSDVKPVNNQKVTLCSYDVEDTREFQTFASLFEEPVTPALGQEHAVMQCQKSDFPYEQVLGKLQHPSPRRQAESVMPAAVEMHEIEGSEWATQCDDDGIAHTTFKSRIPLGYRTVLATRILDGDGNIIKELEEELPWEIKNFNASVNIGGYISTIQYRDGGNNIYEHVVGKDGEADFRKQGNKIEVYTPMGWYAVPNSIMPISSCMHVLDPDWVKTYDFCRWQKKEAGRYMEGMTFGDTEYLGYKCKTVHVSTGTITYWQNLVIKVAGSGDGDFHVTSLEILDNFATPTTEE